MSFIQLNPSQYRETKAIYRPGCPVAYQHGQEIGFSKVESLHYSMGSLSNSNGSNSNNVRYKLEGVNGLIPEASLSFDDDCPVWLEKEYEIVPAEIIGRSVQTFARIKGRPSRPSKTHYKVKECLRDEKISERVMPDKLFFRRTGLPKTDDETASRQLDTPILDLLQLPYTYEAYIPISKSVQHDASDIFDEDVTLEIKHRFGIDLMQLRGSTFGKRDPFAHDMHISLASNSALDKASLHVQETMFYDERKPPPPMKRQRVTTTEQHGQTQASSAYQSEAVLIPAVFCPPSAASLGHVARKIQFLLNDMIADVVPSIIRHINRSITVLLLSPDKRKLSQSARIIRQMVLVPHSPELAYRVYFYWALDTKIKEDQSGQRPKVQPLMAVEHQLEPGGNQVHGCMIEARNGVPLEGLPSERKLERLRKQYCCEIRVDPHQEKCFLFVSGKYLQKVEDLCEYLKKQLGQNNELPPLKRTTESMEAQTARLKTVDIPIPVWSGTLADDFFKRKERLQEEFACVIDRLVDENGNPVLQISALDDRNLKTARRSTEQFLVELFESESNLWKSRLQHYLGCAQRPTDENIIQCRRPGDGYTELVWMAVIELDKSNLGELNIVRGKSNQLPKTLKEKFGAAVKVCGHDKTNWPFVYIDSNHGSRTKATYDFLVGQLKNYRHRN